MDLFEEFQRALREAVPPGATIIAGVSGGTDSLALMHLLSRASEPPGLRAIAVHVHHGIRGAEADRDAEYVVEQAAALGLAYEVVRVDVPAVAASQRRSLEEAARRARYSALADAAARHGTRWIAVGHHADDQAETILIHLLRGTGLAGLRGMRPTVRISPSHVLGPVPGELWIVRPLLGARRKDLADYCAAQGLEPREDASNRDAAFLRNRLRHHVLPLLETISPGFTARLSQTADILAADQAWIEGEAEAALARITMEADAAALRLDLAAWRALPLALQRETIRAAARRLREGVEDLSYAALVGAVEIGQHGASGARSELPGGLTLRLSHTSLLIGMEGARGPEPDWPLLPEGDVIALGEHGEHALPGGLWTLEIGPYDGPRDGPAWAALLADPWSAVLDAGWTGWPLLLRTRQPGDRFEPQGAGGTQKVKDFLINAKVDAAWRDRLPLLCGANGIAWICGWRVDARAAVQPKSGPALLVRFKKHAGDV